MKRSDVNEAAPLLVRMLTLLLSFVPPQGRPGVDARTAIGDVRVNAAQLCSEDTLGPPLDNCFTQARLAGVTWQQFETVRRSVDAETPQTLGGVLVQGACVRLCLAVIAEVLAATTFISRQQVDAIKMQLLQPFQDAEEVAADEMDQMTFQALISLHGAVTNHLVQTGLPLPRMLYYQFFTPLPSLVVAYKLYEDASRCGEVRNENKIVHPAFCPRLGEALSS
jgi:hypothetical protein